ncbi:MAG: CDP-alcohol phosphatidyltransferase family protein [Deltaproteobacteria bacterium]|nr:CDP-alcohol phosphatidyltransferase family protein [Deltaproteobacteria bacterium]
MPMQKIPYEVAAEKALPGDVVAFAGESLWSLIASPEGLISHAGLIVSAATDTQPDPRFVESTVRLTGDQPTFGVMESSFRDRHDDYKGVVWFLSLSDESREKFDQVAFDDFIAKSMGAEFDVNAGLKRTVADWWSQMTGLFATNAVKAQEPFFCSELVAAALKKAGIVEFEDAEEVSPVDLCAWRIYAENYYHLRGDLEEIDEYNDRAPGDTKGGHWYNSLGSRVEAAGEIVSRLFGSAAPGSGPQLNVPNAITAIRLLLLAPILYFLWKGSPGLAAATYLAFLALDAADGWAASRLDKVTDFGTNFDKAADAIVVAGIFTFQLFAGQMHWALYLALLVCYAAQGVIMVRAARESGVLPTSKYHRFSGAATYSLAGIALIGLYNVWTIPAVAICTAYLYVHTYLYYREHQA